jgi:excisionase family DNA binding protein
MADSSDSYQLVSVADAARVLNISDSTVRRLLKAGRLEAEQVQRPQGHIWLVKVPAPSQQPSDQPPRQIGAAGANQTPPSTPPALTVWMTSVLEPIMTELSLSRQQLVSQAETIGRQGAELERAASTIVALGAEIETLRASHSPVAAQETPLAGERTTEPFWPRLWHLWAVLTVIVLAAVAAIAGLVLR